MKGVRNSSSDEGRRRDGGESKVRTRSQKLPSSSNPFFLPPILQGRRLLVRYRAALIDLIFRKALRLDVSASSGYSVGELTNLCSVDANSTEVISYCHFLWSTVLQIAVCVALLFHVLGASAFAGLGFMIVRYGKREGGKEGGRKGERGVESCRCSSCVISSLILMFLTFCAASLPTLFPSFRPTFKSLPITAWASRRIQVYQTRMMKKKDVRMSVMSEILQGRGERRERGEGGREEGREEWHPKDTISKVRREGGREGGEEAPKRPPPAGVLD